MSDTVVPVSAEASHNSELSEAKAGDGASLPSPSTSTSASTPTTSDNNSIPQEGVPKAKDGKTDSERANASPSTDDTNTDRPSTHNSSRVFSADVLQAGISFSDLSAEERKYHVLEMRLRTVRDILRHQTEVTEQLVSFCVDAHRWMMEADAAMRRNSIDLPSTPLPQPPHMLQEVSGTATPHYDTRHATVPASSPTEAAAANSPSNAERSVEMKGMSRSFAVPQGYGMDRKIVSSQGGKPHAASGDASNMLMSLIRSNNNNRDRQNFVGGMPPRGGRSMPVIQPMPMLGGNAPHFSRGGGVNWDIDSENEDYGTVMRPGGRNFMDYGASGLPVRQFRTGASGVGGRGRGRPDQWMQNVRGRRSAGNTASSRRGAFRSAAESYGGRTSNSPNPEEQTTNGAIDSALPGIDSSLSADINSETCEVRETSAGESIPVQAEA